MPKPPPSSDQVRRIVALRRQGMSYREIAAAVRLHHVTVWECARRHMREGGAIVPEDRGPPTDPVDVPIDARGPDGGETRIVTPDKPLTLDAMAALFKIDTKVWIAQTLRTNQWQGFYKLPGKDGGHRKVALWQTRCSWKRNINADVEAAILEFNRRHTRAIPPPPRRRRKAREGYAVAWGIWDAHLGLYAWASEVKQSFDLSIARDRVLNSIDDMVEGLSVHPIEKIWMPVGNDFVHFDNVRQKTTFGEHHLDGDGRYGKVYLAALECLSYQVERALTLCDDVEIIYCPGNHDLTSAYTLCIALKQRYRRDRRVKSDVSFNPRKYRRHGVTLLGFDHGDGASAQQLATIMATECSDQMHGVRYREIQIGHTHQRRERHFDVVTPTNGVTVRTNPALCNVDIWHHKQGLIGEPTKSVEAWLYSRATGYQGSWVTWARDEGHDGLGKGK